MGSEQIGNGVGTTPAYEAEKSKLASITTPATEPTSTTDTVQIVDGLTLEQDSTHDLWNPEDAAYWSKKIGVAADPVDLLEFQDFKRQVISAFKHLGLDIRKHFTE